MGVIQKILDIASGGSLARAIESGAREIWREDEDKDKKKPELSHE